MRLQRLQAVKEIIKTKKVRSQEELNDILAAKGFSVAQATLSRDLKFLKVTKTIDKKGGFYYSLPEAESAKETMTGFYNDLERGVISIGFSGNIGVLHTMPGHANSAAFALDNLELNGILGTIAGDDTVMIILKETSSRETVKNKLLQIVPELELLS